VIFNFASDQKVHFSLKIQRKTNLKTASANCFHPVNVSRACHASSRTRSARTPRHRRTQRSVRRAGSATVGDICERLDGAKWLVPTRGRANRRTPLGRRSVAHRSALLPAPRVHRRRGLPHDPLTDLLRPYKPAPVASRVHAHTPLSPAVSHWRRPV
jgi:hypothetical protein